MFGGLPPEIMQMMGGGGGMFQQRGPKKGKDVGVRMGVPLADLYTGKTREVPLPRTILCTTCKGAGSKSGKSVKCQGCQGQGRKIVRRQMGMMIQQAIQPCDECKGTGGSVSEHDKCPKCEGRQTIEEDRVLKVKIEPGMASKTQIPFPEAGDMSPDIEIPGSIVFVLEQESNEDWTRKGDDLFINKKITLVQALTGFTITHTHLDGRTLLIQGGGVVKPGDQKVIKGEGMPRRRGGGKGDLVITFELDFPRMLEDDQVTLLRKALPPSEKFDIDFGDDEEPMECFMDDYTLDRWTEMNKVTQDEEDDMEEEGGPRGPGVQCAHQ